MTDLLGEVGCCTPTLFFGNLLLILQLSLYLLTRTDESNPINCRHHLPTITIHTSTHTLQFQRKATHSLLDNLPRDLSLQHDRILLALLRVFRQQLLHHISDMCVHVRWSVCSTQIDLSRTAIVTPKGCIVLQTVAGPVLVHREGRLEQVCVRRFESGAKFDASREALPRVVGFLPPESSLGGLSFRK